VSSQEPLGVIDERREVAQQGPTWSGVAAGERHMAGSSLTHFLGGSPLSVLVRLLFVSLVVGALLTWLGISPWEIVRNARQVLLNLWNMGFGAFRELFEFVIAGAILVVPVWLILRLMNARGGR
jgi:hypothetical protein